MHRFNIRVYGILINEQQQVLVSDELIRGSYITKFPGGGLEFGEGTRDCLQREFMEEMNLQVKIEASLSFEKFLFHRFHGKQTIAVHQIQKDSVLVAHLSVPAP